MAEISNIFLAIEAVYESFKHVSASYFTQFPFCLFSFQLSLFFDKTIILLIHGDTKIEATILFSYVTGPIKALLLGDHFDAVALSAASKAPHIFAATVLMASLLLSSGCSSFVFIILMSFQLISLLVVFVHRNFY